MLSSKEFSHLPVLLLLEDFAQDFPSCASIFHLHLVSPSFQAGAINDGSLPSTAVRIFLFSAATETFDPTTSKISSHTISPCPFSYQGKEINSFLWCWQCKVTRPSAVKLWNVLLAPSSFTTGLQHRAASSCPSQPAGGTGLSRLSLPEWPGGVTALGNAQGHPAPGTATQTDTHGIPGIQLHLWLLRTLHGCSLTHTWPKPHKPTRFTEQPGKSHW